MEREKREFETEAEYQDAAWRFSIRRTLRHTRISNNRSRRLRGLPPIVPVPMDQLSAEKPPLIPIAYKGGAYEGRLLRAADCPEGCTVKWERAKW